MSRLDPYLAIILSLMLGAPCYAEDDLVSAQEMFHQHRYRDGLAPCNGPQKQETGKQIAQSPGTVSATR